MDYSACLVEWNRVRNGVKMSRFCYRMILIKVRLS